MIKVARFSTLAFAALAVLAGACSDSSDVIDTAGQVPEVSDDQSTSLAELEATAELPGLPALKASGCEQYEGGGFVAEIEDWVPLNRLVNEVPTSLVEGTVVSISEPRVTSLDEEEPAGLMYFRILTVEVEESNRLTSRVGAARPGTTMNLMLFGAGEVDESKLCYGSDGLQDERELPLARGDRLTALVEVWDVPINLRSTDLYYLTRGLNGLWLEANGSTKHVIPEFQLPYDTVTVQLLAEEKRGLIDEALLDPRNPLETRPEASDPEKTPSTTVPPPPGIDAPDSPTIPAPLDN